MNQTLRHRVAVVLLVSAALFGSSGAVAAETVVTTVNVRNHPNGVGVDPRTNRIYVANFLGNTVSVIDGSVNTVVATVNVGFHPFGVGVNPLTSRIYVANFGDNTVSVIQD